MPDTGTGLTKHTFLVDLGHKIKTIRRAKKMSRRQIAEISDVSQRFLSQFEAGEGNISVARLNSLCKALGITMESVLGEPDADPRMMRIQSELQQASPTQIELIADILELDRVPKPDRQRVALTGLRGAGKSTLGERLANDLQYELIELDRLIEKRAGLNLAEIFSLYGDEGYRRLEREALEYVTGLNNNVVITTGGGIVTNKTTHRYLLAHFLTVWISTSAEEHLSRVIAQGDNRPLAGDSSPLISIRRILDQRQVLYARAPLSVNTSGRTVSQSSAELLQSVLEYTR